VFLLTLALALRDNASWIIIRKEVAIEFFSAVSQSLAALLGLLIVFLTFRIQAITSERLDHYRALQLQIDQLIRLTQELPLELQLFTDKLTEIIDYFVPLQMKDFPSSISEYYLSSWNQTLKTFRDASARMNQRLPRPERLRLQQILLVLNNVDEILEVFSSLYSIILDMNLMIMTIAKLSFLLGISLVFLLLFGIVGLQSVFPDLSFPVVVTTAIWVLIALLELVLYSWKLYKELQISWNHK